MTDEKKPVEALIRFYESRNKKYGITYLLAEIYSPADITRRPVKLIARNKAEIFRIVSIILHGADIPEQTPAMIYPARHHVRKWANTWTADVTLKKREWDDTANGSFFVQEWETLPETVRQALQDLFR